MEEASVLSFLAGVVDVVVDVVALLVVEVVVVAVVVIFIYIMISSFLNAYRSTSAELIGVRFNPMMPHGGTMAEL